MKKIAAILLCALVLGLCACNGGEPGTSSGESSGATAGLPAGHWANYPQKKNDGTLPVMTTRFSCESAAHVLKKGENGCYSPLSLYTALAMLTPGATGETQAELLRALQAEEAGVDTLATGVGEMLESLPFTAVTPSENEDGSVEDVETGRLTLDNSFWLNDRFAFKPPYAETAQNSYKAELFTVPVPSEETNARLNGWAMEKTGGLVNPELEMKDDGSQVDAAYLLNALYYKNGWGWDFNEAKNTTEPFLLAGEDEVDCNYMNSRYDGFARVGEGFTIARMPMRNGATMTLVLPDEGVDPAALLAEPGRVHDMMREDDLREMDITLKLPGFTTESKFDLIAAVGEMGVERAFAPDLAELDEMFTRNPDEFAPPYIGKINQDTKITVDEEGVEAAAVTSIEIIAPAMAPPPEEEEEKLEEIEVFLTRPFLYFITLDDWETSPLFIGAVYDPAQAPSE